MKKAEKIQWFLLAVMFLAECYWFVAMKFNWPN